MKTLYFVVASMLLGTVSFFSNQAIATNVWQIIPSGTDMQLRGLSVVDKNIAWASGMQGTVLKTTDGEHWISMQVPGTEALDFRDVEGFDDKVAIAMSAGPGSASRIYKTIDGGANWKLQITNPDKEGFWDAMAFWDAKHGVVFGDPVNGKFQAYITKDGGETWLPIEGPEALPNEGGFAASGTCLSVSGKNDIWFATGGAATSRVLHSSNRGKTWSASDTPLLANAPPKGLFSVVFRNALEGIAVGGDYTQANGEGLNTVMSNDGGKSWKAANALPQGFLSVVVTVPKAAKTYVSAGLAGSRSSIDAGLTWSEMDATPINTVGFADPEHGWAIGPKGLLMKFVGKPLK